MEKTVNDYIALVKMVLPVFQEMFGKYTITEFKQHINELSTIIKMFK